MLSHHMLQEQTFENLLLDARKQIPLYTKEWTNFNPSDPAQTILENLSAFTILQQAYIDQMPDAVQEKLFAMAGFKQEKGRSARILLEAKNVKEPVLLPSGQRFHIGDLYFETNRDFLLRGNQLTGVYGKYEESITDYSYILAEDYPVNAYIFTKQPKPKMELYLVMDAIGEPGEDLIFYAHLTEHFQRNAFEGKNLFAEIQWQIYTAKGFVNLRCKDGTGCLLTSGELTFKLPKEKAAVYEELPQKGFVIRGILKRADYDIPPELKSISGFLFEVWQKETKSICYTYGRKQEIRLFCDILEAGYMQIFCKESKDGSYYLYEKAVQGDEKGRYFHLEHLDYGMYKLTFDKGTFGYAPGNFDNAVKLVSYSEEIMRSFDLGTIYGYDNQEVILPAKHIVKESFSLIVMHKNTEGETVYDFIRPSGEKKNEFHYSLLEDEGKIVIHDAADYIDGRMFLGGCAVFSGEEGNVRAGSRFKPIGYDSNVVFTNPVAGKGGRYPETTADVRNRLIADLRKHYTAVEAEDYETLVKTTPELCIHKVKAIRDDVKNQIRIAVKPMSHLPFPKLNPIYQKAIQKRLEEARLLTVNIELDQPVYVPVYVRGTIYVKPHYEGCRKQIESIIRRELDYITSDRGFGERFHFDILFHQIEELSCVNYIYELSVISQNMVAAPQKGLDIQPQDNCLLYPGEIVLELNTTG